MGTVILLAVIIGTIVLGRYALREGMRIEQNRKNKEKR